MHEKPKSNTAAATKRFGALLYELRVAQGLSQKKLGAMAGVASSVISEVENIRTHPPAPDAVSRLAKALKCSNSTTELLESTAKAERKTLGLKVGTQTPTEIAQLLREIALVGSALSTDQVTKIRRYLTEGNPMT